MHDVVIVGGGFCGVTAARELGQRGRSVLLMEARDRLGGRTWSADWLGRRVEYGGQWVHWHQPHTFAEITRAGLTVELGLHAERAVLTGELEGLASGFVDDAGTVSVLRWHALSGGSLALTQDTGGHVALREGTGALLAAIAEAAPVETLLDTPVAGVRQSCDGVILETAGGRELPARAAMVAVPLNVLGSLRFTPALSEPKQAALALGQASRGVKLMLHARGDGAALSGVKAAHPFGTWAIHRPGWYTNHHAAMQQPEGRILLAGSDLADGWAGFIDGAIESGLRAAREAARLL